MKTVLVIAMMSLTLSSQAKAGDFTCNVKTRHGIYLKHMILLSGDCAVQKDVRVTLEPPVDGTKIDEIGLTITVSSDQCEVLTRSRDFSGGDSHDIIEHTIQMTSNGSLISGRSHIWLGHGDGSKCDGEYDVTYTRQAIRR